MNPDQKQIEITKPMWTVIAVVMGVGLIGSLREPGADERLERRSPGAYISEDLTVERHANRPVEFPELGLVVTPVEGWSCLTVSDTTSAHRHTFVNESTGLIARLNRHPLVSWSSETPRLTDAINRAVDGGGNDQGGSRNVSRPEAKATDYQWVSLMVNRYQHVPVQWIRMAGETQPGWSKRLLGRIGTESASGWLTVIDLSRENADRESAVRLLCDQIEPLSTP